MCAAGISSVSSDVEDKLQAAALPALVGSNALNPVASKIFSHRVPMGGGGYMQSHSYSKPAVSKVAGPSASKSKAGRQPMPSARTSAYKYKHGVSSNVSSANVSNVAVAPKNAAKYVSPYSQAYLSILRE